MNTHSARFGRATKRLAAVTAAAGLAALGFAAPAAAQTFEPVETSLRFEVPIYAGNDALTHGFEAYFSNDFTPATHTVSFSLSIDIADNAFQFSGGDIGRRCTVNGAQTEVNCVQEAADPEIRFEFLARVHDEAHVGSHPYTVELAVDGEVVHTEEGDVEILPLESDPGSWTPYEYAVFERTGVAPGSTVDVAPEFLQRDPIPEQAKAVVLEFGESEFAQGVAVSADYDNCFSDEYSAICVLTNFSNRAGTVFTLSAPISYTVDEFVPGPFAICNCSYQVSAVSEEQYEQRFGDFTWDQDSSDLMGLQEAADPGTGFGSWGQITLETAEHPVDLSVDDENIKGAKGTETTFTVEFTNDGPADTISHPDGPGDYLMAGSLPTGVEPIETPGSPWNCIDTPGPEDYASFLPELDPAVVEDLDFACFYINLEHGETATFEFPVEITSNRHSTDGTLAVLIRGGVPDADWANNTATLSLNARGHGSLPNTGTSLGIIIGAAALVIVAGAVLLVLTARRRKAGAAE